MRTPPPLPLSFDRGVDNRAHETRLDAGFVRHADNVDIDKDGIGRTRDGYDLLTALTGCHSLWSHELLTFGLAADASKLYLVDEGAQLTELVSGLNGDELSYALTARRVRWSNGVQTGLVALDGTPAPLGVETPLPSFGVAASSTGGMHAGRYGLTLTFADARREEGGAPETVWVDVPEGCGLLITDIPADVDGAATEVRIYVTMANSTELFYAGSVVPGAASFLVGAGQRTRVLSTQFLEPFPPALHLLAKAGRILGSLDRDVIWSAPMYFGLWKPTENSVRLPDAITMIAAPDTAAFMVYVGTRKKTYLLQGETIDSCTLSVASAAGVIPGSMIMMPAEALHMDSVLTPVPVWAGTDGIPYVGTTAGVIPLSSAFAYPIYDKAASGFIEQDGLSRWIVGGQGGRASGMAMGDRVTAEVIQAGP